MVVEIRVGYFAYLVTLIVVNFYNAKEAASKVRQMLFMIRRSFAKLSLSAFAPLYDTMVRPHLEYAIKACSPNLVADADCLEQILRIQCSNPCP